MKWEEDPSELLKLLNSASVDTALWLGHQSSRRTARRKYLELARRWHPDKWSLQGELCVAVATDVTKSLVQAYEQAMRDLPHDDNRVTCEDDDEDREVYEFASWVGVAFEGMAEVYRERRRVTGGASTARQ